MITQFQFKLFSNDPKFREVPANNRHAQQIAVQKVFAGQKQMHRKNLIMDSIAKKSNPQLGKPNLQIDFIQSRMHAFEMMLANDIKELYQNVERIKQAYHSRVSIQAVIDFKLKDIANKITAVDNEVGQRDQQELRTVQKAVFEIESLFEQNKKLKNQNELIAARIEKKKMRKTSGSSLIKLKQR